jgi:hypothetical protein
LTKLRTYLERHIEQFLRSPRRTSLYFRDWRYLTGERYEIVVGQRRVYRDFISDLIADGQAVGEVGQSLNRKYAAHYLIGAMNWLADWYRPDGKDSASIIAQRHAALAICMLESWDRTWIDGHDHQPAASGVDQSGTRP